MLSKTSLRLPGLSLLAACLILGSLATTAKSDVVIRTSPVGAEWQADGTTEYRMDVIGDTTGEPGIEFFSAQWGLFFPSDTLNFVRSELPDEINPISQNPLDFFHLTQMFCNPGCPQNTVNYGPPVVHNSVWMKLAGNARTRALGVTGPSDRSHILGSYFFTVKETAPLGQHIFLTASNEMSSTNPVRQYVWGNGLINEDIPFTVVAPAIPGDINNDGVVDATDIQVFTDVLLGLDTDPEHLSRSEFDATAPVNGLDIQGFVEAYLDNA